MPKHKSITKTFRVKIINEEANKREKRESRLIITALAYGIILGVACTLFVIFCGLLTIWKLNSA